MFKTPRPGPVFSLSALRRVRLPGASAQHRWGVAARVVLASVGGYAFTSLATATLALLLPRLTGTPRAEAVLTASLWSFVIGAVVVMWIFTTRSALRAWLGLGAAAAAVAALQWWTRLGA